MKNLKIYLPLIAVVMLISQCSAPAKQESTSDNTSAQKIRISKAPASPAYEDAALELKNYQSAAREEGFSANFDFEVSNYELGAQTEDASTRGIANSGQGQHIHMIINNGPYSAHYEPAVTKQLAEGNYVALAFLSRSYHESVKNDNSYWIDVIKVGEPAEDLSVDFSAPHLFYSRPKGTYVGADTEKLLIDFFLLNTTLSPEGNKVRATINGEEFIIDEWAPFYIEGLPKGDVTIKLELIDAEGNSIPGPFNTVERIVKLEEAKATE